MAIPDDLNLPDGDPSEGDGDARVPLSEAINAVLDECAGDLPAVRILHTSSLKRR